MTDQTKPKANFGNDPVEAWLKHANGVNVTAVWLRSVDGDQALVEDGEKNLTWVPLERVEVRRIQY